MLADLRDDEARCVADFLAGVSFFIFRHSEIDVIQYNLRSSKMTMAWDIERGDISQTFFLS
jgi:hypothetical protein